MTTVEVGPVTVRGPNRVDDELSTAAIESIDDTVMLVEDRPVRVRAVMTDLLRSAVGPGADELAVVHPSWWSGRRVQAVLDAAGDICGAVVAVTRAEAIGDGYDAVVEIAAEHVAVTAARICTLTRTSDDAVCAAVVREIGHAQTVVVDAPPGVGGTALATAIAAALRRNGVTVTPAATHVVQIPTPPVAAPPPRRSGRRAIPVLAGALVAAAGVGAAVATHESAPPPAEPSTMLVEGRAAVVVPALWTVRRITDGGGSARVQITSPADPAVALHVTQSPLPRAQSLEEVGGALLGALQAQPPGVFTDFHARDERGGRAVVTYRERRARHQTDWVVLVDDTLRIGIGCQSPPGRTDAVRSACDAAVHSAHAVFGKNMSENGTG